MIGMPPSQDNATSRKAKTVVDHLKARRVRVLDWPANSPDLSPIENLWSSLKDNISTRLSRCKPPTVAKMDDIGQDEWRKLVGDRTVMKALWDSMPNRLEAVLRNKGGPSGY